MSEVRWNTSDEALVVSMTFADGLIETDVDIKPNVRTGQLEATRIHIAKGDDLNSGDEIQIKQVALKELMAWFKRRLKKPRTWVRVSGLAERIEIAFVLTFDEYDRGQRERITPLGYSDITLLHTLAATIRDEYAREKKKKTNAANWQQVKREVLRDWAKETPVSAELRDFYSSVLARANAWKWDRVPIDAYRRSQELMPGCMLLLHTQ